MISNLKKFIQITAQKIFLTPLTPHLSAKSFTAGFVMGLNITTYGLHSLLSPFVTGAAGLNLPVFLAGSWLSVIFIVPFTWLSYRLGVFLTGISYTGEYLSLFNGVETNFTETIFKILPKIPAIIADRGFEFLVPYFAGTFILSAIVFPLAYYLFRAGGVLLKIRAGKKAPAMLILLILPCLIYATDFGGNKVQYRDFDWEYIQTRHFDFYYYEGSEEIAEFAARSSEKFYEKISKEFNFNLTTRVPFILYESPGHFEQTNIILENPGESTGGFTELFKGRVVLPFNGSYSEFRHVLHHELTHACMFNLLFGNVVNAIRAMGSIRMPLWVAEGIAERQSVGWDVMSDMHLRDAAVNNYLYTPAQNFGNNFFMAYKAGQSFLNFTALQFGEESIGRFYKFLRITKDYERAYKKATGVSIKEAGDKWQREVKKIYWPEIGKRQSTDERSEKITDHKEDLSDFNLQPRFSPDGKRMAFFSNIKDYRPGLYVMDIDSGSSRKAIRLAEGGVSGTHESFHPYSSGLSWSPDGNKIVLVSKRKGKDFLAFYDTEKKEFYSEYHPDAEALLSPDWSRDGKSIVYTAVKEGRKDIYVLQMDQKKSVRLSNDKVSESDPVFSPDGALIAFAASTAGIEDTVPPYQAVTKIYISDKNGRNIRKITDGRWNETHPSWGPDGSIIFVSDRNGISNLYITDTSGENNPRPLTDVHTGCFSPDYSSAKDMLAFTVFENGGWDIYFMKNPDSSVVNGPLAPSVYRKHSEKQYAELMVFDTLNSLTRKHQKHILSNKKNLQKDSLSSKNNKQKTEKKETKDSLSKNLELPPPATSMDRKKNIFSRNPDRDDKDFAPDTSFFLEDSSEYISESGEFISKEYKTDFSLDLVSLNAGMSIMGSGSIYGGGSALLMFSDLMGNHRFEISGLLSGNPEDFNAYFGYYYLPERIDLLFRAYRFTSSYYYYTEPGFDRYKENDTLAYYGTLNRDINLGGVTGLIYPFSKFLRAQFTLELQNLTREKEDQVFDRVSGNFIYPDIDNSTSTNILKPALSFIGDNTIWNFTGPVDGRRFNISAEYMPGWYFLDYSYAGVYTDYRKYIRLNKKYTFALRTGAGFSKSMRGGSSPVKFYLAGSENDLNWFFPGYYDGSVEDIYFSKYLYAIRGYDRYNSGLSGDKYAMLSMEFRTSFIRGIALDWPFKGFIGPVNGVFFVDHAAAWSGASDEVTFTEKAGIIPRLKRIKGSWGYGLRMNILGGMVLRYDRAWKQNLKRSFSPSNYLSLGAEF